MSLNVLPTRCHPRAAPGRIAVAQVLWLAALLAGICIIVALGFRDGGSLARRQAAVAPAAAAVREIDFGFVELNPGLAVPVTSYKHGGPMKLYPGEAIQYQVLGDIASAQIELHAGGQVLPLQGSEGRLQVPGPDHQALPAAMLLRSSRLSLPGGAPPRVSVKVQVFGTARPA